MLPAEIAPGLLRWTARHPDWSADAEPGSAGDWGPVVGSVLYEPPGALALIDPLLPSDGRERFLSWLDERVAARPVSILTTIRWHRRDREELAERYKQNTSHAWNTIPVGVEPRPLRGGGETLFWLPGVATLVAGDRLIGAHGGGERGGDRARVDRGGDREGADRGGNGEGDREGDALRVCPESWLEDVRVDRAGIAGLMSPLLELPIERVLVSHGEPVLGDGRAALARAIAEAEGR